MRELARNIKSHHILSLVAAGGIVFAALNFNSKPLFSSLDSFVLFAQEEIKLEQGVQVSSGDLGSNGELDIDKDAIINGNLFADRITIDKNSQINGNASYNRLDIKKESKILGTQTKPVSLLIANLPEIPDVQVGDKDFKFEGQNNNLAAGSYRDIVLEKSSRLTLSGGVYNIRKLGLKENATIIFSAPTTLNIKEELKAQENVSLLPATNNLTPHDLALNYAGTKPVEFGKRAFLNVILLAPDAEVHLGEGATFRGRAVAKKVKVGKEGVMSTGSFFSKESDPSKIVTDQGIKFVVNEIVVLFKDQATDIDAQQIAQLVGGSITGFIPTPKIYKIEVRTTMPQELYDKIQAIKNLSNPLIVEVVQNLIGK